MFGPCYRKLRICVVCINLTRTNFLILNFFGMTCHPRWNGLKNHLYLFSKGRDFQDLVWLLRHKLMWLNANHLSIFHPLWWTRSRLRILMVTYPGRTWSSSMDGVLNTSFRRSLLWQSNHQKQLDPPLLQRNHRRIPTVKTNWTNCSFYHLQIRSRATWKDLSTWVCLSILTRRSADAHQYGLEEIVMPRSRKIGGSSGISPHILAGKTYVSPLNIFVAF